MENKNKAWPLYFELDLVKKFISRYGFYQAIFFSALSLFGFGSLFLFGFVGLIPPELRIFFDPSAQLHLLSFIIFRFVGSLFAAKIIFVGVFYSMSGLRYLIRSSNLFLRSRNDFYIVRWVGVILGVLLKKAKKFRFQAQFLLAILFFMNLQMGEERFLINFFIVLISLYFIFLAGQFLFFRVSAEVWDVIVLKAFYEKNSVSFARRLDANIFLGVLWLAFLSYFLGAQTFKSNIAHFASTRVSGSQNFERPLVATGYGVILIQEYGSKKPFLFPRAKVQGRFVPYSSLEEVQSIYGKSPKITERLED